MGRIIKCHRYVIDVTGLDPLSLRELRGVQCFGELGASGRARAILGRNIPGYKFSRNNLESFSKKKYIPKNIAIYSGS